MPIRNALMEAGRAAENRGAPLPVATLDQAGNAAPATAALGLCRRACRSSRPLRW